MRNDFLTIDLHGFRAREALEFLHRTFQTLPDGVQEVNIIHGYRSGTVLRQIVREEFYDQRIQRMVTGWNPGETTFLIQKMG